MNLYLMRNTEPMTRTLWDITHDIALDDSQVQEREDWIAYVASLEPEDDPLFELELDMWESNR